MIISFRNNDVDRDRGNKNTNKIPNCGDNCSNPDNDGSVVSFESTANDQRTSDDDNLPGVKAPAVNKEFGNYNINDNVVIGDDDDGDDDDNNEATTILGVNKDSNSEGEDLVFDNDNANSTFNPTNGKPPLILLVVLADDDGKDDLGDYDEFCSNYDLDDNGVFDNDDADIGEGYYILIPLLSCGCFYFTCVAT